MSNTTGTGDAGMDMGAEQGDDFSFDDIARETLAEVVADTGSDETGDASNPADAPAQPAGEPQTQDAPAATQTPAHWSPEEQAAFDALPPETKALVEKRTAAIEADYKDRATLGDEVKALVDPDFQKRLVASGMSISQGVAYLANLERFATTQPAEYLAFVAREVQGQGVDVAKVLGLGGQPAQDGQPADDGFTDPKLADLESRLARYEQNSAEQTRQRVLQDAGNQIASVRDAKDAAGNLLRPHFAKVENDMARLIKADPKMTLEEAYDAAVWSNPAVRAELQKTERETADKKARDDAAAAQKAARSNVRAGGRPMSPNTPIESADDAAKAALAELQR